MGGGTSDAEFSIINSVEPFADYPAIMLENYSYSNSFVKVLSRNGYATKAFHGNEGLFWNRLKSFREMGYQEFYDIYRMGLKEKGWGAPDSEVFDYSLNEMKKEKGPYYYHIITMTSHGPFNNVLNYYRPESYNHIESDLTRDYFISMNYVDRCISNFISRLPDPQNTIVLIYGDHCPEMPIKDYKQPYFIYKERKFEFVPLFVIAPGKKAYQENKLAVSFLSYAPTVLLNSGITFSYQSDGANLLDYPVKDGFIPLQGDLFQQSTLYQKIEDFESK